MNITSSFQVRIVNCSVNLNDTVRIYQGALSYLIGIFAKSKGRLRKGPAFRIRG